MALDCVAPVYRTASINGFEFNILNATDEGGKRGPTHEFPDRDTPASEDLGRKAWRFQIEGYLNGADHISRYMQLVDSCMATGPATLVHPAFGTQQVKIDKFTGKNDFENMGRETRFTIECAEWGADSVLDGSVLVGFASMLALSVLKGVIGGPAGLITGLTGALTGVVSSQAISSLLNPATGNPIASTDALAQVSTFSNQVISTVQNLLPGNGQTGVFDSVWSLQFLPSYVLFKSLDCVTEAVGGIAREYQVCVDQRSKSALDLQRLLNACAADPVDYSGQIALICLQGLERIALKNTDTNRARQALQRCQQYSPGAWNNESILLQPSMGSRLTTTSTVPAQIQNTANLNIITTTVRVTAVAAEAALVFQDPSTFASYADALDWYERVYAILDQEALIAVQLKNDALYRMIKNLATSITQDVLKLAYSLPTKFIIPMCDELPSLVAAHRIWGDATRATELENSQPGFASTWFLPRVLEAVA